MFQDNIILLTDSYKHTHAKLYPPGTQRVFSYLESRGGLYPETCFFGLQYYLKRYLEGQVVTRANIEEADYVISNHFNDGRIFNRKGWELLLERHGGRLPVIIKAVPEGTVVPTNNALITIENTDTDFFWLTNHLETLLSEIWYSITVSTRSREIKKSVAGYLDETGDPSTLDFKVHDFGFRGVSSVETAGLGGAAHLVNFKGTDTLAGIMLAMQYYGCGKKFGMPGFSVPASEHSTMTAWGREHEADAYSNALDVYPDGILSVVSDSYDIYSACSRIWGDKLKERVLKRNGLLVIRPDSGQPLMTVMRVLTALGEAFGTTTNNKGYKLLDPHVRVIQGDGINHYSMCEILRSMKERKWSADNITFGSGGGLLQSNTDRDTLKFAFKCSWASINGQGVDVYKDPITDPGKVSKKGRLQLFKDGNGYKTIDVNSDPVYAPFEDGGELQTVFNNGVVYNESLNSFSNIRKRAAI